MDIIRSMKSQPKPLKAYNNPEFMDSVEAREVRVLAEFLEPKKRLQEHKIVDTLVFFGSARINSKKDAAAKLKIAQGKFKAGHPELEQAKRIHEMSRYYEDAVKLSKMLTLWAKDISKNKAVQRYIVCSGGGPGIMEAANKGAHLAKGESVGFNISIPFEQNSNAYITKKLNFEFHYFFIRKYWFAYMAKALIVFPGGFGTLDELFEVLTLCQTHKMTKSIPILIYGKSYWDRIINIEEMINLGTVSRKDLSLFHYSDDPEDAFNYLTKELVKRFGK